jgi:FkbM family methyltransferase
MLDRPGGRFLLGKLATRVVQNGPHNDIEIRYIDGFWTRRVGGNFLLDGSRFGYRYCDFGSWNHQISEFVSNAKEYWFRHYKPKQGDVILDIGAGRGEDVLAFSRAVGASGRVIAIEAHPDSFAMLKSFCRLNGLSNVTAIHAAVMDKPGIVHMADSSASWQENTVTRNGGSGGRAVPATTVDEICEQCRVQQIDFLKMNIEGAEIYAIQGMLHRLPRIRQLCIACHDFRAELGHGEEYRTRQFIEKELAERGFTTITPQSDNRDFVRDHLFGFGVNRK